MFPGWTELLFSVEESCCCFQSPGETPGVLNNSLSVRSASASTPESIRKTSWDQRLEQSFYILPDLKHSDQIWALNCTQISVQIWSPTKPNCKTLHETSSACSLAHNKQVCFVLWCTIIGSWSALCHMRAAELLLRWQTLSKSLYGSCRNTKHTNRMSLIGSSDCTSSVLAVGVNAEGKSRKDVMWSGSCWSYDWDPMEKSV